jgi:putative ABC transport system ATP-binding protein
MSENKLAKFRQDYLGFVFQSYNLIGSMTALENVEFPLVFKRVPASKRRKMAVEMLKNVGLKGRMQHKPKEMSGGQQQRVGIARAFVAKPAIVFADEPTGNLDSKTTIEVMDMLKAMARKNNQTVVMVTHDRKLTEYADKIINILDGKIQSIEVQESSKEGKFIEPEKDKKTEQTVNGSEETRNTETDSGTVNDGPGTGFDIEYETRKLEEAAQQMFEEERKVKENESIRKND